MTPDLALVVLFGALGGSLFGYDLGLIGGVLASLNGANATRSEVSPPYPDDTIYLDEIATELVVGGCKVGAALGALLCMWLLPYGHHTCFVFSGVAYVLGPVIMAAAPTWPVIVVGRVVTGIGVGASAVASPAYLGEVAPAAVRGAIVATYELALCLGLVVAVLVDWLLALDVSQGFLPHVARWRIMLALPAVPGMLVLLGCLLLPPSPLRLVQLGREAEAYELMLRLQLPRSARASLLLEPLVADAVAAAVGPPSANTEGDPNLGDPSPSSLEVAAAAKAAINAAVRARDVAAQPVGLRALFFGRERRAAWLLSALALCNQANGSSTVVNYASQLLRDTGQLSADDATVLSACVGATKLVGVMIAMRLVDCLGRRPLLIAGAVLTAASLLGTAAAMQAEPPSPYLLLLGLAAFVLFYGLSLAPVFFVLLSEVFTDSAKPAATGTLLALTFLGGAVIDSTFNSMLGSLGDWGTFGLLAAICLAGGAISYAALPETKGRTLWEVQRLLGGGGITHALVSFHQGHARLEACKPAGSKRFSATPSALLLAGTSFGGSFASGGGSYAAGACSSGSFLGSRQGSQAVANGSSTTRPLLPSNGPDETLADDVETAAETDAELNALLRKMSSAVVLAT
jgi:SP family arabinose:H+ symporter-like MFS transporter